MSSLRSRHGFAARIGLLGLAPLLPLAFAAGAAFAQPAPHRGDVDGDWRLNVSDAYAIWRHVDGRLVLPPDALARADVNRDGVVDAADVDALSIPEPCAPIFDEGVDETFPSVCAIEPESAAPGDTVLVRVRGFSAEPGDSRLYFGAIRADVVPIDSKRLFARVPDDAETAPVTLVVRGVRSLGRPFEVERPTPRAYTIVPPGTGEFVLGVPRLRPRNDDIVSVPLVACGAAELGAYTTSMEYDAGRLHGVWVDRGTAPFSAPPDPCIDNLIGRAMWSGRHLGPEGRLRAGSPGGRSDRTPLEPSLLWLVDVRLKTVFAGATYPRIRARVQVATDRAFPAAPLGAPSPRDAWFNNNLVPDGDETAPEGRPVIDSLDRDYAAPGTRVTIRGAHFGSDPLRVRVWIDTVKTPPVHVQDDTIDFVVPENARSGFVRVHVGGRGQSAGTPLAVTPDDTAPSVLSLSPPNGRRVRDGFALANVVFDEVVDPSTIHSKTVWLEADSYYDILADADGRLRVPCAYRIQNGPERTVVTLTPVFLLPPATGFRIHVSEGVTDLAGNPLRESAAAGFRTR